MDSLDTLVGDAQAPKDDPAYQSPSDPLADGKILSRAGVVRREIPAVVCGTGWDVGATRQALEQQCIGLFDFPAQLCDSIAADSRVQAAMASRTGGVLGRPVDFLLPTKHADSAAAKECRDAFIDAWPSMAAECVMSEIQRWAVMLGFGVAQIIWDTSGEYAIPRPIPWYPRFVYWHFGFRCYVALTQDGPARIAPGDGSWILHAPHGEYRGWMQGAMRAIAPWWLARHYALRDWARYSERHGLPMIKAKTPSRGDPTQINEFRLSLATLGQETVIQLPQVVEPGGSFDVELLEAKDTAHEGFRMLISQCDTEITLSLLAQNLTTEVKEGSYAAARVHADVRQALLEADARGLALTIYQQLARPFAAMNFGNADLAPRVLWNVEPYEDGATRAGTLLTFSQSLVNLKNAGLALEPRDVERLAKSMGVDIGHLREVEAAIAGGGGPPGRPGARARIAAERPSRDRLRFDPRNGSLRAVGDRTPVRIAAPSTLDLGRRFIGRDAAGEAIAEGSEELREHLAEAEAMAARKARRMRRA